MIRNATVWSLVAMEAALAGCSRPAPPSAPQKAHYVGEQAWQGDGVWFYPRETYEFDRTGLAAVYAATGPALVSDGEAFDNEAMAAGMQTLQLPAIVRVTNLENGRQVRVRVNDHAPASPHRLITLTRRAAALLGVPTDGTAEVRVTIDESASRSLTAALGGGAPKLDVATAPRGGVMAEALGGAPGALPMPETASASDPQRQPPSPASLPMLYAQGMPAPGSLWIRAGEFTSATAADRLRAELGPDATTERLRSGRTTTYRVKSGPFPSPAVADRALDEALAAGVVDARIVVE